MEQKRYNIDFETGKITEGIDNPSNVDKFDGSNNQSLAIVGSRTITDEAFVNRILNAYKYIFGMPVKVVSGGARGIDTIGEKWADKNNIDKLIFPAEWDKYGKSAGFIRNEDIIKNCDVCLAIWDGGSNGTKNDFEHCKKYHKDLILFNMKEFKSGEFSGFHYIVYPEEKISLPQLPECSQIDDSTDTINEQKQTTKNSGRRFNRWLPQPGIISI